MGQWLCLSWSIQSRFCKQVSLTTNLLALFNVNRSIEGGKIYIKIYIPWSWLMSATVIKSWPPMTMGTFVRMQRCHPMYTLLSAMTLTGLHSPYLAICLSPCHRFPLKLNDELEPTANRHTPNYCTNLACRTHRPTEHRQNTNHRQRREKNPVSPERLTPWSTLDLRLSSKGRISVRLRSESKGKGSIGRGDEFEPWTTRSDQVQTEDKLTSREEYRKWGVLSITSKILLYLSWRIRSEGRLV